MAMPFGFARTSAELLDDQRGSLIALLQSYGYRAMAAAHFFGAGLRFAPDVDEKLLLAEQVMEDLEHVESIVELYAELGARDLLAEIGKVAEDLPPPRSWLDISIARIVFSRAARAQLCEHRALRYEPFSAVVSSILSSEERRGAAAAAAFAEIGMGEASRAEAQACLERWMKMAIRSFERIGGRDRDRVLREFLLGLEPVSRAAGLRLPEREVLGLEARREGTDALSSVGHRFAYGV